MPKKHKKQKDIKCLVWDLDGTLWEGILLEQDHVKLKPGIRKIIRTLDSRGILQSIASKNDPEAALSKVREFGLGDYFLFPEIGWNAKSVSIQRIRQQLNIGMDSILFIDDQPFERDEVRHEHPQVHCLDASEYKTLLDHPRLNPRFLSGDSRRRRLMYLEDIKRKTEEKDYQGPKNDFLRGLGIEFSISQASLEDLQRAEELMVRTNQLNTTGIMYSYDQLKKYVDSASHRLFIAEMKDKYGSFGKIGLALVKIAEEFWHIRLFLMSCRVMSYGVGTVFLTYILRQAGIEGKRVLVDFKETGKNRMMLITLKFAGFKVAISDRRGVRVFENNLDTVQDFPPYIRVLAPKHLRGRNKIHGTRV
jgi:FkbH-like protein